LAGGNIPKAEEQTDTQDDCQNQQIAICLRKQSRFHIVSLSATSNEIAVPGLWNAARSSLKIARKLKDASRPCFRHEQITGSIEGGIPWFIQALDQGDARAVQLDP
jgi:hypothetical protein